MIVSWKLPTLAVAGAIGAVAFLCPACGNGGRAQGPAPAISEPVASATEVPAAAKTVDAADPDAPVRNTVLASAALATVEFDVEGMTCGGCATATEIALKRLDGVRSAEATYEDESSAGRAVVEYDPAKVSPERMIEAIEAIGYRPRIRAGG